MTDAAATAVDKGIAMQPGHIDKRLEKAAAICKGNGDKLTQKRQRVLKVLMETKCPLSAYELTDCYNQEAGTSISAVSVYRILNFLASVNPAYRLSTLGKYIACERIGDKTAIGLSLLSLVHCLALPVIFMLLPTFAGIAFFTDESFHQWMLYAVIPVSSVAWMLLSESRAIIDRALSFNLMDSKSEIRNARFKTIQA